ncbi:MAG: protein phosphatase 2C domain-containing protein [Bacteroides sp.]|nr:protein phosphatase 2C domain-containing protein [Bacteroides sp.]
MALHKARIPGRDRKGFIDWTIERLWSTYKEERMNERVIIENEIRQLGIRLPNGTVKKDYSFTFALPVEKIGNIRLEGAEELGLEFTVTPEGICTLSGKPTKAGDYQLRLSYATVDGEPRSELDVPVAFNPNPRDLWKNIPTDNNIVYYKQDSATEYVKVECAPDGSPAKDIVAASQRGRSHAQEGKARDDHFSLYHCTDSDWYIIAVADGAGSAKYSRKGSQLACETVTDYCRKMLLDNPDFEKAIEEYALERDNREKQANVTGMVISLLRAGAINAYEKIRAAAEANEDARIRDFSTTLMFAICKKYDFGWFIATFWVGDGAMCLLDKENRTAKLLGTPDEGEYSGQTRFLTMKEVLQDPELASKRMRFTIVPDFTALFLMTDGVSDPMFETDRNLKDYSRWEEFYEKLRKGFPEDEIGGVDLSDDNAMAKDQLLRWLDFWSPGNHDDRTIAILY